jgi:hypothetical protein
VVVTSEKHNDRLSLRCVTNDLRDLKLRCHSAQSPHFHADQVDYAQNPLFEFNEIHRKEHCSVSDRRGSIRSCAETPSQAQFLQQQSLSLSTRAGGRAKRTSFNEPLRKYNLAVLSSFKAVGGTNPKGAAMHGCVTFINFSFNLTIFVPIELTKQLQNNLKTIIPPPIQLSRTCPTDTDRIASFKS